MLFDESQTRSGVLSRRLLTGVAVLGLGATVAAVTTGVRAAEPEPAEARGAARGEARGSAGPQFSAVAVPVLGARRSDPSSAGAQPSAEARRAAAALRARAPRTAPPPRPIVSAAPNVAVLVDGVFESRATTSVLSLSDVAAVDRRTGPIGTLRGRNNFGNFQNFITRKPGFDFGGSATLRVGNYDLLETKLTANVPLIPERLAARIGLATAQRDGYSRNRVATSDDTAGRERMVGGRLQLLWNASQSLELNLSGYWSYEPRTINVAKCKFVGFGASPRSPEPAEFSGSRMLGALSNTTGFARPTTGEQRRKLIDLARDGAETGGRFRQECVRNSRLGTREVTADGPLRDELRNYGFSLSATWSPMENLSLRSTTSVRQSKNDRGSDSDATRLPLSGQFRGGKIDVYNDSIAQEFTLSGSVLEGQLSWTAGVFGTLEQLVIETRNQSFSSTDETPGFVVAEGLNAELNQRDLARRAADPELMDPELRARVESDPNFGMRPTSGFSLGPASGLGECVRIPGDTFDDLAESCLRSFIGSTSLVDQENDDLSYAAYLEASYSFSDRITLSGGLRYTHERRFVDRFGALVKPRQFAEFDPDNPNAFNGLDGAVAFDDPSSAESGRFTNQGLLLAPIGTFTDFELSERFGRFTPRFSINYQHSDSLSAYLNFSRGFSSARFDGRLFNNATSAFVEPEEITQYEAGFRSRWLGGLLTVNGAAYTQLLRKLQRTVRATDATGRLTSMTTNAGSAVINGGQLDVVLIPLPGLTLLSSAAVQAARYQKFNAPGFSNLKLPDIPAYTLDFTVNYSLPVASLGRLTTRVTWHHESEQATLVADPRFSRASKHGVLGGRLAFQFGDRVTSIAIFGSNLLDREYITNSIDFSGSNGSFQEFFAPPRTFGLEISRRF